jgi:zinc transporter ZupT
MGDVGVLMKSRFTGCQSIFFNSSPNVGTIIGAVIALAIGEIN